MITIIHFSQDFQKNKIQLGGYSRVLSICSDSNNHIIFTIDKTNTEIIDWVVRDNITIVAIPLMGKSFSRMQQLVSYKSIALQISNWLGEKNITPDIIFGHSQLVNYFILKEVKKKLVNSILIWELNVIWGIHPVKGIIQKLLLKFIFYLQKIVIKGCDHLVAQTNLSKQYIIEKFDASDSKISVIENAIMPEELFNKNNVSFINEHRFICYGLFDRMNGIPFLLETLKNLEAKVQIDFFGNGPYLNDVKLNAETGVINYKGTLPRELMIRELRNYSFIIIPRLPEIDANLFIPTKLIECMANGVVPICADVMGMKEVVKHGQNGFLFKAGNITELNSLLVNLTSMSKEKWVEMSKNAIETIQTNYTWDVKHQHLNNIYNELIVKNSR